MPASITGIVFNDLNHNGVYNAGEPGIPSVYVVLYNSSTGCSVTQTDVSGNYSFSVSTAATYTIYETVSDPGTTCPPTNFTQPSGFYVSNGPRALNITISQPQIDGNSTIANNNFSHDTTNSPLPCSTNMVQFAENPSVWFDINLITGISTNMGSLIPAGTYINAFGYNVFDNYLYGYGPVTNMIYRIDANRNATVLSPLPPGLPTGFYLTGDIGTDGFYYLSVNANSVGVTYYVVDLRPNSPTFMKLVNPNTGLEQTSPPYGVNFSGVSIRTPDWSYNPVDNFIYAISADTGDVLRLNPKTGLVTSLTTTGSIIENFGAVGIDATGTMYAIRNTTGGVYKIVISGSSATVTLFSNSAASTANDGAICKNTIVESANLSVIKSANVATANPGDTLTYTLVVNNAGPLTATNVIVTDTVPLNSPEVSTNAGFSWSPWSGTTNIGNMLTTTTTTLLIRGIVPTNAPISLQNTASVSSTIPDPNLSNNTSTISTTITYRAVIDNANGGLVKYVNPNAVKLGETITYTIRLTNTGNTTANNVYFTDTLPIGTSLAPGSANPNPPSSIPVGSIGPNATSTVTFKVLVTTLSSGGTIPNTGSVNFTFTQDPSIPNGASGSGNSNTVVSYANDAVLSSNKSVSSSYATLGDTLTYTVAISNSGNSTANNVIFIDTIPASTTFVSGSLVQDGTTIPSSPNPPGATLSNIAPNTISTVTFKVYVYTLPASNPILNTATTNFNFVSDPSTTPNITANGSSPSNSASTTISFASLGNISKSADKSYAICGDTLTYTITLPNSGNVTAINVVLYDTVPNNTSLVPDSVTVNGATKNGYNPTLGITIPNITPGGNATITFKVVVTC